jgi:hypothetical protein
MDIETSIHSLRGSIRGSYKFGAPSAELQRVIKIETDDDITEFGRVERSVIARVCVANPDMTHPPRPRLEVYGILKRGVW